jgi:hypothetical protein
VNVRSATLLTSIAAMVALGAPASGSAVAMRGEFGPRSQADIRISVSVAPRFHGALSGAPGVDQEAASIPGRAALRSNAPTLRYSVLAYPASVAEAARGPQHDLGARQGSGNPSASSARSLPGQSADPGVLLLIVPD